MSQFRVRHLASVFAVASCASALTVAAQSEAGSATHAPRIATGVTVGTLRYSGGRTEDAASALLKLRIAPGWSASIEPTFARATEPASGVYAASSNSGLTDVPLSLQYERAFAGRLSPSLDVSLAATLPVGNTATGFGTGTFGTALGLGAGVAASENLGVYANVGRTLSSVAAQSAFNGGASGWGDLAASYQMGDRLSLLAGYSTDLGAADSTYGRGRSASAGIAYTLAGPLSLNVETSHGFSGATPRWSAVIGIGTAFGSLDGARQLLSAFGGGRHGLKRNGSNSSSRRHA